VADGVGTTGLAVSALLSVSGLSFGYPGRGVGRDVDLSLAPGEILCLLGPNGGGKTTLFRTILGLIPALAGTVSIDGADISHWSARRRARAIGYVPQSGGGSFAFTVREIVLMGRSAHRGTFAPPAPADYDAAQMALDTLGIAHLSERDWTRISGGERQLALIARALAQEPRVMVLDEPTANLDFGNQVRVMDEVRRLGSSGLSVLFSTHHPEQAFACAHRVALLHEGRLADIGEPGAVITEATMRRVYGLDVEVVALGGGMSVCLPRNWRAS
jgi:iron complex transport system ATP-binding protein